MDDPDFMPNLITLLATLIVCAVVGYLIGDKKGRGPGGAFWGFILGPLGWILVAALPEEKKKPRKTPIITRTGEDPVAKWEREQSQMLGPLPGGLHPSRGSERLNDALALYEQGLISEEEYQAKRQQIINEI